MKGVRCITVYGLSIFLFLFITVSTSFSASQNKDTTESSSSPGIKKDSDLLSPKVQKAPKPVAESTKPKDKFWDLSTVYGTVNGKPIHGNNKKYEFYLKPGDNIKCKFYYKLITPNIKDITKADAKYWGAGTASFGVFAGIKMEDYKFIFTEDTIKKVTRTLPAFTYQDVKKWEKSMKGGTPKVWSSVFSYTYTVPKDKFYNNQVLFLVFSLGGLNKKIPEKDYNNNVLCDDNDIDEGSDVKLIITDNPPGTYQRSTKPTATKKSIKKVPSVKVRER